MTMNGISREELMSVLKYVPAKGHFVWKTKRLYGRKAGSKTVHGYIEIRYKRKWFKVHRLAWFFIYGELPQVVDHIDRDKTNNRIENLRASTIAENNVNRSKQKNNSTGLTGVQFARQKYVVVIKHQGKRIAQRSFDNADDAAAYREAKLKELGYDTNHGY